MYFDSGAFTIQNCYNFINLKDCQFSTNLKDCQFSYKFLQMPDYGETKMKVIKEGKIPSPDVAPHQFGKLRIEPTDAEVIQLTATDPKGQEVFTWSVKNRVKPGNLSQKSLRENTRKYTYTEDDKQLLVTNGQREYTFCKQVV